MLTGQLPSQQRHSWYEKQHSIISTNQHRQKP